MDPQWIIARLDAAIAGYGQTVTLRRTTTDANGAVTVSEEVTCPAAVRNFGPQSLESGESREIQIVVSPTGLGSFGVPRRDDKILIGTDDANITEIAPLSYGGALCRVNLLCRG